MSNRTTEGGGGREAARGPALGTGVPHSHGVRCSCDPRHSLSADHRGAATAHSGWPEVQPGWHRPLNIRPPACHARHSELTLDKVQGSLQMPWFLAFSLKDTGFLATAVTLASLRA